MDGKGKKYTIIIICLSVFFLLAGRLYKLQIIDQMEYGLESRKNSIRKIEVTPPRGLMLDNKNKIVVDNLPSYALTIIPKKFDRNKISEVGKLIDEDTIRIGELIDKPQGTNRFNPIIIKRRIEFRAISYLEENREIFPGVDYKIESIRNYPINYRGSHIFGYIGEISDAMLEKQEGDYYRQGDLVGITGLEKYYELQLRGEKGVKLVTADVNGKILGSYNEGRDDIKSLNGSDLYLTIDSELQNYCERLLGGRRGAIVVMNPNNGEILALVSKPDFDLTIFSGEKDNETIAALFSNPNFPMFNRVIQTRYPPGSTWKMMMAMAGMGSGKITPGSTISCGGSFTYGGRTWSDHGSYGPISVVKALEVSANVFFYKLALMIGLDNYNKYSKMFGFGTKTGIDLPGETSGLVPSTEYFDKVYGEGKWGKGLLVSLGIGQGELGVSPVQMVAYTSAICMNGIYSNPHLVRQIKNLNTGKDEIVEIKQRKIELPASYFQAVKRGMYLVVNGGSGTARNVKSGGYSLAGKTGTAQNTKGNNHSWFVGFAPFDNPQIAVCVLGENQGWGNEFAAPLAAAIMVRYLSNYSEDVYSELNESPEIRD
ncbi:MAG: penicillin-binding protein 2 [Ignavibacteria bacterium]|nr:penicillin-binding protein 2 [Ignavibacteria bacterium]